MILKYALIGCGRISPNHIVAALRAELNIIALCDIIPSNIDDKILKFNLPNTIKKYTNYKELLVNEKPDLIAICTESGKHAEIALDCIKEGCNLIIEKPITLSLKDADLIIQKAKEKNLKISPCHQNRFNKSIQKIREAVEKNRFGRLFYGTAHIRWNRAYEYYSRAKWRGTWDQDGGALMNQCIHNIDLLQWMMGGKVTEVVGMIDNLNHGYIEAEDLGIALIKFSNGSYGVLEGTTTIYPTNLEETLYLFGEKGTVKAGGQSVNLIEEWRFADLLDDPNEIKRLYHENPPNVYGFGHTQLYADVIDAIEKNRDPYVTSEDGKKALELVLAIYKSAKEGRAIKLPINDFTTIEMKGFLNGK